MILIIRLTLSLRIYLFIYLLINISVNIYSIGLKYLPILSILSNLHSLLLLHVRSSIKILSIHWFSYFFNPSLPRFFFFLFFEWDPIYWWLWESYSNHSSSGINAVWFRLSIFHRLLKDTNALNCPYQINYFRSIIRDCTFHSPIFPLVCSFFILLISSLIFNSSFLPFLRFFLEFSYF